MFIKPTKIIICYFAIFVFIIFVFVCFFFLVLQESHTDENINLMSTFSQQQNVNNLTDENSSILEYKNVNNGDEFDSPPIIDEARSNISSSIGPAISTPSPSSRRNYKPVSLTSTQTYFKNIQDPRSSSPVLQLRAMRFNDDKYDDSEPVTVQNLSSTKHGVKKDTIATVRFQDDISDEKKTVVEETYL